MIQVVKCLKGEMLWRQTHSHFGRTGSGSAAHFTVSFCFSWVLQGGSTGYGVGRGAEFPLDLVGPVDLCKKLVKIFSPLFSA